MAAQAWKETLLAFLGNCTAELVRFLLVKRPELAVGNCIHLWIAPSENWIKLNSLGFCLGEGVGRFLVLPEVLYLHGTKTSISVLIF